MLSKQTIDIIKATAPILETSGEELTRHFYRRMFRHNPEVLPYFNQAHQNAGQQQKALAAAICAYAANIDRLDSLGQAVELIAQKHASLQIKPEHYAIVGENLLASIREVLGLGSDDPIIDAWARAFGALAAILIGREGDIYQAQANTRGGWSGFKPFKVIRKEVESDVITSFYLLPKDGDVIPSYRPGQYITLRVPTSDGKSTTMRNYSLSDKPGQNWLRISVKREDGPSPQDPEGYVSNLLHKAISVGSEIEIAAPCGEFILDSKEDDSRPLFFLAGGVGITPIYSMLHAALEANPRRSITLIHAVRNEDVQPFQKNLEKLAEIYPNVRIHYRYSEAKAGLNKARSSAGFVDGPFLDAMEIDPNANYFICGPKQFFVNVNKELLKRNVPAERIRSEFFGPRT